jgi:general secretion pathway protein K
MTPMTPIPERPCRVRPRARQRGAALLTAMIIVTLVVTLAASMVWQQWRAVQVEAAERARTQAAWILAGALDFARLILKENTSDTRPTALGDPWATPLAEARLSTFLAADKSNPDDGPEAFLSGSIVDMQARFNLANLVLGGKVNELQRDALMRLCGAIGVDPGVAQVIATGLLAATYPSPDPQANPPLLPVTVDQLSWLGIEAATIKLLAPHVVLLPGLAATPVNVNTASREVLVGVVKGLDLASAERLVQLRQRVPFRDLQKFGEQVPTLTVTDGMVDIRSSFFEVRAQLRLADRVLVERSLVQRKARQIEVLRRERTARLDEAPP